jgi:hypothetical protein
MGTAQDVAPLRAAGGVRVVQGARNGPEAADGWSARDDATAPGRLYVAGGSWKPSPRS